MFNLRGGRGRLKPPLFFYRLKYLYIKIVPTTYKKIPKKTCNLFFLSLWAVFAPTLAINIVIGIKIKNAGIFINPILKGSCASNNDPENMNPVAPNNAIIKPIAAALPIAFLIGYPKYLRIGTFITAPPIPIGADIKPDINPKNKR
tara:strand:- start:44 stop:481 length:438 start_codon:yes stop_codon:yes gene_type:complete